MNQPTITRASMACLLSQYLSALLRADIRVSDDDRHPKTIAAPTIANFLQHLPRVTQQAVDGAELVFALPLVASGKGTSLSPSVANVVCELLFEQTNDPAADVIEVPTFFYSDGSTMVIEFWKDKLEDAVTMLVLSQQVRNFVQDAIVGLKG